MSNAAKFIVRTTPADEDGTLQEDYLENGASIWEQVYLATVTTYSNGDREVIGPWASLIKSHLTGE